MCVLFETQVRGVFSEWLILEQRQEEKEQTVQFPGRIPLQAEESGGQKPCGPVRLEQLSSQAKGLDPSEQAGEEKDETREEL